MAGEVPLDKESTSVQPVSSVAVAAEVESTVETTQNKGWIKGALGMALCCAAPLLLLAAAAIFGFSLGALASGAISLLALLACPVAMFLMMRSMMKDK